MNVPGNDLSLWLFALSTAACLVGLGVTYWLHSQYRLDVSVNPNRPSSFQVLPEDLPWITVIIPARNESRNIRRCAEMMLQQTYPRLEIIVVDDRSTDGTARILSDIETGWKHRPGVPSFQVIHGADLPRGWAGKPHALAQGAAVAKGDWLCFVDADTFAEPELIVAAYRAALEHQADLFSIFTRQEFGSFWEKVILPLVFTALSVGFSPSRVNDPDRPEAVANGQFILIRRDVYEALGGHAAIRAEIVEDKALAEKVKHNGYRLLVGDGRLVASTRMYTRFGEIWEGWTKNIYLGLRDRLGLLLVGAVVGFAGALVLPFWQVGGWLWFTASGTSWALLITLQGLAVFGVLLYARLQTCKAFGISPWYAFTFPLGALVFTAMMVSSTLKVLSGRGVTWKGRRYVS